MKRIFCDCCNTEFEYNLALKLTSGMPIEVSLPIANSHIKQAVEVKVNVVPLNVRTGEHKDICSACRYTALQMALGTI